MIVAGPPIPPEMIWKRSFENLMSDFSIKDVLRSIFFKPLGTVTYSKCKWSIAFDDSLRMSLLVPRLPSTLPRSKSVVTTRPVARSLFGGLSDDVSSGSNDHLSAQAMTGAAVPEAMAASDLSVPEAVVSRGSEEISSPVVFSAESQIKQKNLRGKRKVSAPLLDTLVRRCTRSAAKLDGFKPVIFEQLSL